MTKHLRIEDIRIGMKVRLPSFHHGEDNGKIVTVTGVDGKDTVLLSNGDWEKPIMLEEVA